MDGADLSALNIALVIESLAGGGAERVVLELAKEFTKQGHNTVIIGLQNRHEYDLPTTVPIHFLYKQNRAKLYKKSKREEHVSNLLKLFAELESNLGTFDLILSNLDESHYLLSACQLPNTYFVVHNAIRKTLDRALRMGPIKYFRQRRLFKSLNGKNLIAVSKGLQQELLTQTLFKPRSVGQIYNPFNIKEIVSLSQKPNAQIPSRPYLIHVGRFAKQKRHDVLFDALKVMPDNTRLVCLGANKAGIEKLATKKGVLEKLIVPEFQQNPYNWIARAECLVLSSDFEGFGNVLIEAQLCETRVVSTDCDFGPNEILTGNLANNLVPVRDSEKLANRILKVLQKPKLQHSDFELSAITPDKVTSKYLALVAENSAIND